ncbi:hypothetical protein WICPIJ_006641 [Wickerhamomyces pijperi]|uniref:Uncharacterized protein n=1 Tax=Wickerhamomyces pijperi TaxID=599730 RepID=A0A9P8Q3C5_WICPI|nr:hypothetical protein WICPIJ_006641 [Wickerhamomyces pijperi]
MSIDFQKDLDITLNYPPLSINNGEAVNGIVSLHPTNKLSIQKISIQFRAIARQRVPTDLLNSQSTPNLDDALDDVMDHPEFIETEEVVYDSSCLLYPAGEALDFDENFNHELFFEFQIPENDEETPLEYGLVLIVEQDGVQNELIVPVSATKLSVIENPNEPLSVLSSKFDIRHNKISEDSASKYVNEVQVDHESVPFCIELGFKSHYINTGTLDNIAFRLREVYSAVNYVGSAWKPKLEITLKSIMIHSLTGDSRKSFDILRSPATVTLDGSSEDSVVLSGLELGLSNGSNERCLVEFKLEIKNLEDLISLPSTELSVYTRELIIGS